MPASISIADGNATGMTGMKLFRSGIDRISPFVFIYQTFPLNFNLIPFKWPLNGQAVKYQLGLDSIEMRMANVGIRRGQRHQSAALAIVPSPPTNLRDCGRPAALRDSSPAGIFSSASANLRQH